MAKVDFFENGLCISCHLAKSELAELLHFHNQSEKAWKNENAALQRQIDEVLAKYPKEVHGDIVESHGWELYLNQNKFPNIHRESILITIYNFFEAELNNICYIISDSIESKLKLKHLQGKGRERALLYLTKVADFDFSTFSTELSYLKNKMRGQVLRRA